MTGVVFIICIPVEKYEKSLKCKVKKVFIRDNGTSPCGAAATASVSAVINDKKKMRRWQSVDNLLVGEGGGGEGQCSLSDGIATGCLENSPVKENYEYISMYKLVKDILNWYSLGRTTSTHVIDDNYVQFLFAFEEGPRCEEIVNILRDHGVGRRYESTISIMPCSLYYQGCENEDGMFTNDNQERKSEVGDTAWTRFVSSVRARLTVAQIVEVLKGEAAITFDFLCLLLTATILCAIGLVENSNIYLLSSMLISPMMGPVMAGTFGTVIRDRALQRVGVQSELIGLGVATVVGFCYGSIICLSTDKYGENDWPTSEMISRGEIRTLGVGCLIALLSGAAVAVGVLSDNIASLVGVAISTSLMPPAVNAGLLWSLATVYYLKGNETTRYVALSYTEYYSTNRFYELSSLGAVSLCLTFVNIICIYVAAIAVFKIKEVAPMSSKHHAIHQFWKYDIRIARDYNKTLQRGDGLLQDQLQDNFYDCKREVCEKYRNLHHSSEFPKEDLQWNSKKCQYTWSPYLHGPRNSVDDLKNLFKGALQERRPSFRPSHCRRLSQIFNQDGNSSRTDDSLSLIPEVPEKPPNAEKRGKSKGKKFTVTRCEDVLNQV